MTFAFAPAANAADTDCPSNNFCLWEDINYALSPIWAKSGITNWQNFATSVDNEASSGWNRRVYDSLMATGAGGGGTVGCFNQGGKVGYLANLGATWQDSISSARNLDTQNYC